MDPRIGQRIVALREGRAWTQEELAEVAGLSPRTVQRAERGNQSKESLKAIAAAFDLDVRDLLTPPTTTAPLGAPKLTHQEATALLSEYRQRFSAPRPHLATLVEPRLNDGTEAGSVFLRAVGRYKRIAVLGPSGQGKSHFTQHQALHLARMGEVVVWASAKYFRGDIAEWLDSAIAPYTTHGHRDVLEAAAAAGTTARLFVDGANECPVLNQAELRDAVAALQLRYQGLTVIMTAFEERACPAQPEIALIIAAPTPTAKEKILGVHAATHPAQTARPILDALTLPLEIAMAADCLAQLSEGSSRYQLFGTYVRHALNGLEAPGAAFQAMVAIADEMSRRVRQTLPIPDVLRVIERLSVRLEATTELGQQLIKNVLLDVQAGDCSFRHEMFLAYFRAESLLRSHAATPAMLEELQKPRNSGARPFVLQAVDRQQAEELVEELASADIIRDGGNGDYGKAIREIITARAEAALGDALGQPPNIAISSDSLVAARVTTQRRWTHFEQALFAWAGRQMVAGQFLVPVRELALRLDHATRSYLGDGDHFPTGADLVLRAVYVFNPRFDSLPLAHVVMGLKFQRANAAVSFGVFPSVDVLEPTDPASVGLAVLFATAILRSPATLDPGSGQLVLMLARKAWATGVEAVRMDALDMLQTRSWSADPELESGIREFLESLDVGNDLLLGPCVLEALDMLGAIEAPVTAVAVQAQIAEVLKSEADPEARAAAYNVYCNQFEVFVGEAHCEAILGLSPRERVDFLCAAILGSPTYSSSRGWCVRDLVESPDFVGGTFVVEALQANARPPESDPMDCFSSVAAFAWAHVGLARAGSPPFMVRQPLRPGEAVWMAVGHLLYALERHAAGASNDAVADEAWRVLEALGPQHSIAPLYWLARSHDREGLPNITHRWRFQTRALLHRALRGLGDLLPYFKHGGEGLPAFVISTLAAVGNEESRVLLESFVDSKTLGAVAIEAIRTIDLRGGR